MEKEKTSLDLMSRGDSNRHVGSKRTKFRMIGTEDTRKRR